MKYLTGIIAMACLISCTKETKKNIPPPSEITRTITPAGGKIIFRKEADFTSDVPHVVLSFPAGAVAKNTTVEIFTIENKDLNLGKYLPLSDVLFLSPKTTVLNAPASVEYHFDKPTPEDNVYNYQNIFQPSFLNGKLSGVKLYEIAYQRSMPFDLNKEQNWTEVNTYALDTAAGTLKFEVSNFDKAYCLAFPEYARNDTFILKTSLKHYTVSGTDQDYQNHITQGFMGLNGNNYLNTTLSPGDTVVFLKLNFTATGPGVISGAALDFTLSGYYFDWSGTSVDVVHFDAFTEWGNTQLEIYEYGAIGQRVRGRLKGTVQKDFGGSVIPIDYYFSSIRTR
ncbi:MAG: hypothetical protein JNL57_01270 [Bacteroidetes bacterium]|nr:hypothetical protein [Bacteroidota bacterium]